MLMVSTSLTPISQLLVRKTMVSLHSLSALAYKIRVFPRLTSTTYRFSSAPKTAYPLQYELIRYRPVSSKLPATPRGGRSRKEGDENIIESTDTQDKCESESESISSSASETLDKSKRKYYRKRRKRMYGSETDDERPEQDRYIELKPEIVDFPTVQSREEELYFYDAFAYPWEKDKHYRMVYQLEKKYFPDQCLDKAFLDPGQSPVKGKDDTKKGKKEQEHEPSDKGNDNGLIFFEEEKNVAGKADSVKNGEITEKKVEDFFKSLKKAPKANEVTIEEPFLISRRTQLPHRWDGPNGTVVLINKPKGWTSFTVCGKLRRLVKVQKVGHAGTLDPMATGLLIVCVGKATKLADRYQGMIKGYSGVFRLGEATSTWDADSPVIQREPWEHIKDADIKKAAASFCGEIWQVPPMFSAIKVDGEKMYEKARRGEMVELSPRRVSIFQFDIERSLSDRQNLIFRVVCSKGTYIRSLCADFGKTLKSCAHLTALRRDSIGEYSADDAWEFEELQELILKNYL